ncbi:MAG: hypothetical protein CL912_16375 [Deltaproteobacteria bacterium]|nr:hypothetical protein [Deltaproteobacteria bacterium]
MLLVKVCPDLFGNLLSLSAPIFLLHVQVSGAVPKDLYFESVISIQYVFARKYTHLRMYRFSQVSHW